MQVSKSDLLDVTGKSDVVRRMADNPESNEAIGKRLEITRLALGYRQQTEIVAALGTTFSAALWNNWERGRERPKVDSAIELCKRFQLTLDWIYRGDKSGLPLRLVQAMDDLQPSAASRRA